MNDLVLLSEKGCQKTIHTETISKGYSDKDNLDFNGRISDRKSSLYEKVK